MPEPRRESTARTLLVAFLVCAVCSLSVSTTAILLEPRQRAHLEREREARLHEIVARQPALAELLSGLGGVSLEARVVELATGSFADHVDAASFDARKAAQDPLLGEALPPGRDPAGLGRRARLAVVYVVEVAERVELLILPVSGSGYASTLHGYLALAGDLDTVAGLSFYEHAETPGLGSQIEDPDWLASWQGKRLHDERGRLRLGVAPGEHPDAQAAAYEVDGLSGATFTCDGVTTLLRYWLGEDGFAPLLERLRRENELRP